LRSAQVESFVVVKRGARQAMDGQAFLGRLLPGERMIWSGRPGQGIVLVGRDAFLIPFSLIWCGFAIFWEATVLHTNAPGFFALWGIPFVAVGLYFVVGRFLVDAWVRRGTSYGLTDRRVLISKPAPFGSFTAISLNQLPNAQISESASGRGTIRFGQSAPIWGGRGFASWSPALDPTPQFIAIDDARSVFDLMQRSTPSRQ
jgi:hypothetical protein